MERRRRDDTGLQTRVAVTTITTAGANSQAVESSVVSVSVGAARVRPGPTRRARVGTSADASGVGTSGAGAASAAGRPASVAGRRAPPAHPAPSRAFGTLAAFGLALGDVVGADVVALLVVGVLAVELAVLGRDLAALGGLLDRQRDAPAVEVDVDDLHPELLARRDDLLGRLDVVRGHLGDVHQTLDAFADLDERAERHELGDPAVDELADLVAVGELLPRVLLRRLERQRDALAARGRRRAPAP